jgi:hypothetical protein
MVSTHPSRPVILICEQNRKGRKNTGVNLNTNDVGELKWRIMVLPEVVGYCHAATFLHSECQIIGTGRAQLLHNSRPPWNTVAYAGVGRQHTDTRNKALQAQPFTVGVSEH